jgi:CheY-like chemotaxis protein
MEVSELTPIGEPVRPHLVVMVEDNPRDVELLTLAFRERRIPVRVISARGGAQLQILLRSLPASDAPRLVIVDLSLPVSSGHAVLEALRNDPRFARTPKVVFTSSDRESDRAASFAAGAVEHLVKPAHFAGFLAVCDRLYAYLISGAHERA